MRKHYKNKHSNTARNIFFLFFVFFLSVVFWGWNKINQSHVAEEWFETRVDNINNITLPKDDGHHSAKLEWWYYNGHLVSKKGKEYSFHFTTFLLTNVMSHTVFHASLTDHQQGQHYIEQKRLGGNPSVDAKNSFNFKQGNWLMTGKNGQDRIKVSNDQFAFDLHLNSTLPVVNQGDEGILSLDFAGSSYYYSRTRMNVSGKLEVNNKKESVKGIAWFDHQWGDFSSVNLVWDWFSLQFDNGDDLMLYQIRDKSGKPIIYKGNYTERNGKTEVLEHSDFVITAKKKWLSKKSNIKYPVTWHVKIPKKNIDINLTSIVEDSEFDAKLTTYNIYWEGAVKIDGSHTGKGFVELNGYLPETKK